MIVKAGMFVERGGDGPSRRISVHASVRDTLCTYKAKICCFGVMVIEMKVDDGNGSSLDAE